MNYFFKATGGVPVDRSKKHGMVDSMTNLLKESDEMIVAVPAEGTRSRVSKWKTGFYYIALKANLPILMVSFDYMRKEVKINDKFYPSGDIDKDFIELEKKVNDVVTRNAI